MRASQVKQPGGPDQISIGQVPIPEPKEKQVLLKVYASAINRADTLQVGSDIVLQIVSKVLD